MKIILQPEVRNLSNRVIAENSRHLINLISKLRGVKPNFSNQSTDKKSGYSCN